MVECKKFKKQQIEETKRTLRERFTEHRQAANNDNPNHANSSAAAPSHFTLAGHFTTDMKLMPLELLPTRNNVRRKA